MPARRIAAALGVMLYFAVGARAEYESPVGLRQLVRDADLIVLAEVVRVEEPWTWLARWKAHAGSRALLRVETVLKGATNSESVIANTYEYACGPTTEYEPGQTVLAFLVTNPMDPLGAYDTLTFASGVKYPDRAGRLAYGRRIAEVKAILAQSESRQRTLNVVAWIVRCLADPATRREGILELENRRMGTEEGTDLWRHFTASQEAEVAKCLEEPQDVWRLMSFLALCRQSESLRALAQRYSLATLETEGGRGREIRLEFMAQHRALLSVPDAK